MQKIRKHPIYILLIINIAVGLFTFRDYGLSWDEPLFYDYANALGYAYTPREWFSGNFNLENAFGSSATDHANRGPAYILLAHPIVSIIKSFGVDHASAWHLVNFLTFQLGVYLLYRLARRWVNPSAALAATALLAWQPLLWGHAFINPKDPPFLVFFLGAVCFGFEMIDKITQTAPSSAHPGTFYESGKKNMAALLLASFFLGVATSIRILGPLAGILVGMYALGKLNRSTAITLAKYLSGYLVVTTLIVFITWPYLWTNPLQKFIEVFGFMSDNPTQLPVLFNGQIYQADKLPRRYLPSLLGLTLTEPVWLLFILGLIIGFWKSNSQKRLLLALTLLWFIIPGAYVVLRKPPMYDGFRHFLFILPPVFIFTGFAFEKLFMATKKQWVVIAIILFAPAIWGSIKLHPYEYAYYNLFTGGTSGAFRVYETEYWLTCYKEAVQGFHEQDAQLFIKREPYIAQYYANKNITIRDYRVEFNKIQPGDFVLVSSRTNEDLKTFKDAPIALSIQRGDAVFCAIKQIP